MPTFSDRRKFLQKLSAARKRSLLTLVTSTKKPEEMFGTQIAQDILPVVYDILKDRKRETRKGLDLFIHSSGGQIDVPWPLVNLVREYFPDLIVLVPWRAQSAATLLALGANTIEMGPMGSLSPIDPQFQVKLSDKQVVGAGVEDVYGFYRLVTETLGLDSAGKAEALKLLGSRVSPEILGKISRVRREIRVIATNLLQLHINGDDDKKKLVENIVAALVEELPSHQYMINRREARQMGMPVKDMDAGTEKLCRDLLESYIEEARMEEPGMGVDFGNEAVVTLDMNRAFVESVDRSFTFRSTYTFHRDGKVERKGDRWQEAK